MPMLKLHKCTSVFLRHVERLYIFLKAASSGAAFFVPKNRVGGEREYGCVRDLS